MSEVQLLDRTRAALHVVATISPELLLVRLMGELDLAGADLIDSVDALDLPDVRTSSRPREQRHVRMLFADTCPNLHP